MPGHESERGAEVLGALLVPPTQAQGKASLVGAFGAWRSCRRPGLSHSEAGGRDRFAPSEPSLLPFTYSFLPSSFTLFVFSFLF